MRRGPSSPVTGALLGVLLERPGYGYELAQRLTERMGPSWRLTPSSIYPVLERLEASDLVRRTVKDMPGRQRQRERIMFHATDAAVAAFDEWLARPARKEPIRTELLAKIAVARPSDAARLLQLLNEYERECQALLADGQLVGAAATRSPWNAVLADVIERAADQQLHAELDWVGFARHRIGEYLADGGGAVSS